MCYDPIMLTKIDDLFNAALVALGPPIKMPGYRVHQSPDIPRGNATWEFNQSVSEYNAFVQGAGFTVMREYSYEAFSEWFHKPR